MVRGFAWFGRTLGHFLFGFSAKSQGQPKANGSLRTMSNRDLLFKIAL